MGPRNEEALPGTFALPHPTVAIRSGLTHCTVRWFWLFPVWQICGSSQNCDDENVHGDAAYQQPGAIKTDELPVETGKAARLAGVLSILEEIDAAQDDDATCEQIQKGIDMAKKLLGELQEQIDPEHMQDVELRVELAILKLKTNMDRKQLKTSEINRQRNKVPSEPELGDGAAALDQGASRGTEVLGLRDEEEKAHVFAMSARAQKKWDELDTDRNDKLDGDEVMGRGTMFLLCSEGCEAM